ncbi:MAG: hypothetical protein HC860_23215 [Alkalinema sp. RU_4_3]|nr:hypothetical protein [Alkalinema sp. RU_4_3]
MQIPNSQISQISEKWIKVLSTPIVPGEAIAIVSELYQHIGNPAPKVVFVDSPWAASVAAERLLHQSSAALTPVHDDLLNLSRQIYDQILRQYLKRFDPAFSLGMIGTFRRKE